METLTISNKSYNMYTIDDFQELDNLNFVDLNNKLFCTFTTLEGLEELLERITTNYSILYKKYLYYILKVIMNMFVLII